MAEGVSLREFGRQLGVSGEAVRKAIKTGRIPANLVGQAELSSGRRVPIIMDAAAARTAFAGNTNPVHRQDSARISAGKKAASSARAPANGGQRSEQPRVDTPDIDPPGRDGDDDGGDDAEPPPLADSIARKEAYKAKLARLEFEEKAGRLVDADEFRQKFTSMVATARTRLLGVPSKAKGRIPHLTVDEIAILTTLMREALEEVSGAR